MIARRIYKGPFPQRPADYYGLAASSPQHSYVYALFDKDWSPIYVGMSVRPGNRFDRHRRRRWWCEVDNLALLQIVGPNCYDVEQVTREIEAQTIRYHRPAHNRMVSA